MPDNSVPSRLVVVGASGFLGTALLKACRERGLHVTACHGRRPVHGPHDEALSADLTTADGLARVERRLDEGGALVNCAAATNVNACEENPDWARAVNASLPEHLARCCSEKGARLIHISTDAVFDGVAGPYREEDPARPLNAYARTKLEGEEAVRRQCPTALVVRTNIIGWSTGGAYGLTEWIYNRLTNGEEVPGFTDVVFNPVVIEALSGVLLDLLPRPEAGLLHVAAEDAVSKYAFAGMMARAFALDEALVKPVSVHDAGFAARRPEHTALNTDKLQRILGRGMGTMAEAVEQLYRLKHPACNT